MDVDSASHVQTGKNAASYPSGYPQINPDVQNLVCRSRVFILSAARLRKAALPISPRSWQAFRVVRLMRAGGLCFAARLAAAARETSACNDDHCQSALL